MINELRELARLFPIHSDIFNAAAEYIAELESAKRQFDVSVPFANKIRIIDDEGNEITNADRVIFHADGFEVHQVFPHRVLGGDEVLRVRKRFINKGRVEVDYER